MGALIDDLREDVAEAETLSTDEGVFVVTMKRRRPGSIFMDVVRILEHRIGELSFESPLRAVVDLSDSALSPSGPEIQRGALRLAGLGKTGRIALLVANDFQFGLGRMLSVLCEGTGFDIRPFRDASSATSWVGQR